MLLRADEGSEMPEHSASLQPFYYHHCVSQSLCPTVLFLDLVDLLENSRVYFSAYLPANGARLLEPYLVHLTLIFFFNEKEESSGL